MFNMYPYPRWPKIADPVFEDENVRTVQQDPRYHNMNATAWCFATFVDYVKCQRLLGENHECCPQFKKIYQAICPNAWIARWEEQLQEGTFPLNLPDKK